MHVQGYDRCFPDYGGMGFNQYYLTFTFLMACLQGDGTDLDNYRLVTNALWTFPKAIPNGLTVYNQSVLAGGGQGTTFSVLRFIDDLYGYSYGRACPARPIDAQTLSANGVPPAHLPVVSNSDTATPKMP